MELQVTSKDGQDFFVNIEFFFTKDLDFGEKRDPNEKPVHLVEVRKYTDVINYEVVKKHRIDTNQTTEEFEETIEEIKAEYSVCQDEPKYSDKQKVLIDLGFK